MLTIRSILVQFDSHPASAHRLQVARRIAERHGASIAAAYIGPTASHSQLAASYDGTPASLLEHRAIHAERQRAAFALFEAALTEPGPHARWIETEPGGGYRLFVHHALFSDLLVLGARTPEGSVRSGLPADFAESVILDSGRPAIVVPPEPGPASLGHRIVVAWKAEKEAMRAVTAALPLLQQADQVHLAHWSEPGPDMPDFPAIQHYLRLHDIEAVPHKFARSDSVGEAMLALGHDVSADLLVMGCYGHARMRELVLGGATRSVLASPTLPLLMAH